MTVPKVNTFKKAGSRFYINPSDDRQAPGVTSVLNMIPKPFLQYWGQKLVAQHAVDNAGALVQLALNDPDGAVDWLKRAPQRSTSGSANVGTEVHDLYEQIASGKNVGRVHPDLKPYVTNFHEWIEQHSPNFLYLEDTVWSDDPLYAGSFDWLAEIDGKLVMGDNKTTKSGVHAEVALQLNAYAHADVIIKPDGTTIPMPKVEGCAVFHSRPEGWSFVPVRLDPDLLDVFRALSVVMDWEKNIKRGVIGSAISHGERDE